MPDTDIEVKSITIKVAGDDVKLTVQFQGLATVDRAEKLRHRLEYLADELSGQTKLDQ
jgi:hypothetical protein